VIVEAADAAGPDKTGQILGEAGIDAALIVDGGIGLTRAGAGKIGSWRGARAAEEGAAVTRGAKIAGATDEANQLRQVSTGGLRNEIPLTEAQSAELVDYAKSLGIPEDSIISARHTPTAYGADWDVLILGTDALPASNAGVGTLTANSRISGRGAIAHELIGHREAALAGKTQAVSALEEAQASIRAARFGPQLSSIERFTLLRDGISRLRKNGFKIRDVKEQLWISEHK
jgi:hypothetical protein